MPITVADLAKRRKEVTFTWPGAEGEDQEVKLVYNPGWLTGEREAAFEEWDKGKLGELLANWVSSMLVEWDVLDEKGQRYPTDYDSIYKLDRDFIAKCRAVILQDLYPNPKSAEPSGATS